MKKFQELYQFDLSDEERNTGEATVEHIASAIAALHRDGMVVINNAVDPLHAETLHTEVSRDIQRNLENEAVHFNSVWLFW